MNPPADDVAAPPRDLRAWFGDLDIYIFDQLLKGRITPGMAILDAGCGGGRNLHYLLRAGHDVHAVDASPDAVAATRALAASLVPGIDPERFRVARVEALPFPDARFDVVISLAVLHFAEGDAMFEAMVGEMWRVLRPGGMLLVRLSSSIGLEHRITRVDGRLYRTTSGAVRYLADEAWIREITDRLGGEWMEPLKTTNVQDERCMTTWVLRKPAPPH